MLRKLLQDWKTDYKEDNEENEHLSAYRVPSTVQPTSYALFHLIHAMNP